MRFTITNSRTNRGYKLNLRDKEGDNKLKKDSEEEICKQCEKKLSECQCDKEESKGEVHDEKIEMSKEEAKALKELIKLLPDLKKIIEGKEAESKKGEEPDEDEDEKEAESEEEPEPKKDEDLSSGVILEEGDNEEIGSEESDFDEDEIIEDEGGNVLGDSIPNPGTIEKHASACNEDAVTHEIEVAEAWSKRYEQQLQSKK